MDTGAAVSYAIFNLQDRENNASEASNKCI